MSLRTRINGFTAWINIRLEAYDGPPIKNVVIDFNKGSHLQNLLHSLTSKALKKLQSLDGLTVNQITTRMEWFVDELKKSGILLDDAKINCKMISRKSAEHIFDLLWRIVAHDIWFTWERMEFLQQNDDQLLSFYPFEWTPVPPPKKKRRKITRNVESMMSGFGSKADIIEEPSPDGSEEYGEEQKWPGAEKMKKLKPHRPRGGWYSYPSPDECILDMINSQLEKVSEGHKFSVDSLDDLVDSRALCGLINSFIPGSFTTEVMLNDRWTINLALRTAEKMLHATAPLEAADLSEADPKSICSYMCFFFMNCYKLKQSKAVVNRLKELTLLVQETIAGIEKYPAEIFNMKDLKEKRNLENNLDEYQKEQERLHKDYDIEGINEWLAHIKEVQMETRKKIAIKMNERFDLVEVPRNMTINELCMSVAINLQLTQGSGFYKATEKESCGADRRIVLRHKKKKTFIEDFTGGGGCQSVRKLLGLPESEVIVIDPLDYADDYDVYFESLTRNKTLKVGQTFLYQVFPGRTVQWHRLFFKSVRNGDYDVVKKMVMFFEESHPGFIHEKEMPSGNTALHVAAKFGHFKICKYLLENGCNVNSKNLIHSTPLFFAAEGLHKKVCQLLIEWGSDTTAQNFKCETALVLMRHEEMRASLEDIAKVWMTLVPEAVGGNLDAIKRLVKDHFLGIREISDKGARGIQGSTMIHTAVHFSDIDAVKDLLQIRVDVNLEDYKRATPLHRAKTTEMLQLLLDCDAEVDAADKEGNTALHAQCYGEKNKPSLLDGVTLLLQRGADITYRNKRELTPLHCAAMQGRLDIIELILADHEELIKVEINDEKADEPPSLPYLAMVGNHLHCAKWLFDRGFLFKEGECDQIMYKVLCQEVDLDNRGGAVTFLLSSGGTVNLRYEGGDTSIHLAARMAGPTDILEKLLEFGAKFDAANDAGCTPLFEAMKLNNFRAASILIKRGADVRHTDKQGLTALDGIHDYQEWIECPFSYEDKTPYFTDDVTSRFKAYSLKHSRDLVRNITQKLRSDAQRTRTLMFQAKYQNQQDGIFSPNTSKRQRLALPAIPSTDALSKSFPNIPDPTSSLVIPRSLVTSSRDRYHRRLALPPVSLPVINKQVTQSLL